MAEFEERTEEATPRKRQRAREKGQVPRSKELLSMVATGSVIGALLIGGEWLFNGLSNIMEGILRFQYGREPFEVMSATGKDLLLLLMPYLGIGFSMALIGGFLQGGIVLKAIDMDLERINPLRGFKRLFSLRGLFELLKGLLKFFIGGAVLYLVIKNILPLISVMPAIGLEDTKRISTIIIKRAVLIILITFFIIAVFDYIYERFRFERSLRMTRQELKEEFRETEGDPIIKARIRSLQREFAKRRMLQEVQKATVVVTNPTHIAVALLYKKEEMPAPKVIAKGAGFLAEKIKEIARAHSIPIYEDKVLARTLFKLKIDSYIPEELYRAVAKIIAYIYKLRGAA